MHNYQMMPKVNLHHHLEGAVRPATFWEVCQQYGLGTPVSSVEEAQTYLQVSGEEATLAAFLDRIHRSFLISSYPGVMHRIAYESVADAAKQNIAYLEVRFGPSLHGTQGRSLEATMEEVLQGISEGERDFGTQTRLIVCALRHLSFSENNEILRVATKYRDCGVVGFDIAGDEECYGADQFRSLFHRAQDGGLGITVHAGEVGTADNIVAAITKLGASRIGHGIALVHRPDLVEPINASGITLEVCPTSNVHTAAVSSLAEHPVRWLFDQGVKLTIGDDDPTTSGISLSSEYQLLSDYFEFSDEVLSEFVLNGARASFLHSIEKQKLMDTLESALLQWRANPTRGY